jgi:hypothetical protein
LWRTKLKPLREEQWTLDQDVKALLPTDFTLDAGFKRSLKKKVLDPILRSIVDFLLVEAKKGSAIFAQRQMYLRERLRKAELRLDASNLPQREESSGTESSLHGTFPSAARGTRREVEASFGDNQRSLSNLFLEVQQLKEKLHLYETCKHVFVSSGGQSADPRLQDMLKESLDGEWTRSPSPRTNVVDGLMHMIKHEQSEHQNARKFQWYYGYIGWNEDENTHR